MSTEEKIKVAETKAKKDFQKSESICDQCLIMSSYLFNNRGGERIIHLPKITAHKAQELRSQNVMV